MQRVVKPLEISDIRISLSGNNIMQIDMEIGIGIQSVFYLWVELRWLMTSVTSHSPLSMTS